MTGRRKVRGVFLDAGNTLLAPDPPVDAAYGRAFARWGLEAPFEAVGSAIHATWGDVASDRASGLARWGGEGGERGFWRRFVGTVYRRLGGGELPEPLLDELISHFHEQRHWAVYPDVLHTLETLRERGLSLLVVSNWDSTLPSLLERLGLAPFFDHVVVSALVGVSKPDRRIFDHAREAAGLAPDEALHVGDSPTDDYDGAREAGLSALLLDRSGVLPERFDTIRSLAELASRLPA